MSVMSPQFLLLFIGIFSAYWWLGQRWQNWVLLAGSYFFYCTFSIWFGVVLLAISLFTYVSALLIDRSAKWRRTLFCGALGGIVGALAYFKYANFFVHEATELLRPLGVQSNGLALQIVLPVGLSFYALQAVGYIVDVYRKSAPACRRLSLVLLYFAFFPQVVAGPIERAKHMLPQFGLRSRAFDYEQVVEGFYFIALGLLIKTALADRMGPVVLILDQRDSDGIILNILSGTLFILQLYFDFFGYTTIARGLAKSFGIELSRNFNRPLFATNPVDYWQKWHITLSSWARDYLYFPLIGALMKYHRGRSVVYLSQTVAMIIIGVWHGANWTFFVYGLFWAAIIIAYLESKHHLRKTNIGRRFYDSNALSTHLVGNAVMFVALLVAAAIFRAPDAAKALIQVQRLFVGSWRSDFALPDNLTPFTLAFFGLAIFVVEFFLFRKIDVALIRRRLWPLRAFVAVAMLLLPFILGDMNGAEFFYARF